MSSTIPSAAPRPANFGGYAFPAGVTVSTTPVKRPIDPDTDEPIRNTMEGCGAWAPRRGDVAAATFAQEQGSGFYGD